MKLKRLLLAAAGVGLGLALAQQSQAISLWSFEDDDIDFILRDTDGDGFKDDPVTSGDFQIGDVFLAVFEIPVFTIDGVNAIPPGMEITGVAAVELQAINPTPPNIGTVYDFKPFADFNSLLTHLGYGGTPLPAGAAVAMWVHNEDLELNRTVNPATNCTGLADCVTRASAGDLLQVDGAFDPTDFGAGDPDEFWFAVQTVPADPINFPGNIIGQILATDNSTLVASVNFGLSNLFHDPTAIGRTDSPVGYINAGGGFCGFNNGPAADGCVQLKGSATLTGGQGLSNGAIAHSDFDAQKYVPEPATLALFGIGLLGLGGRMRRRA